MGVTEATKNFFFFGLVDIPFKARGLGDGEPMLLDQAPILHLPSSIPSSVSLDSTPQWVEIGKESSASSVNCCELRDVYMDIHLMFQTDPLGLRTFHMHAPTYSRSISHKCHSWKWAGKKDACTYIATVYPPF